MLAGSTLLAVGGLALLWWNPSDWLGSVGLVAAGFGFGPVFPLQVLMTPRRVGEAYTPWAVGYQVAAANVGAVVIPGGLGLLVAAGGLEVVGPVLFATGGGLLLATEGLRRLTLRLAVGELRQTTSERAL
jgi:hypothetical protein